MSRVVRDIYNDELIAQLPVHRAKERKLTTIDRSETCFKGKQLMTISNLNPDPSLSYRLRVERRW